MTDTPFLLNYRQCDHGSVCSGYWHYFQLPLEFLPVFSCMVVSNKPSNVRWTGCGSLLAFDSPCELLNISLQCFDAVGWAAGRAACKNWWGTGVVICLERGANDCIWSSWCHCQPVISCSSKIQNALPVWCRLSQVVLEKRPLNGCSSTSSCSCELLNHTEPYPRAYLAYWITRPCWNHSIAMNMREHDKSENEIITSESKVTSATLRVGCSSRNCFSCLITAAVM